MNNNLVAHSGSILVSLIIKNQFLYGEMNGVFISGLLHSNNVFGTYVIFYCVIFLSIC